MDFFDKSKEVFMVVSGSGCGFLLSILPGLIYFFIFMQLLHWFVVWALSANTRINIPDSEKAKTKVVIIGAGFSGLGVGVLLKQAGIPFVILEKAEHFGGTWWYNNYPGAAVDVKSHTYCYSFFRNPVWSHTYSYRDEILQYIRDVVAHYGLSSHIRHKTEVKCGNWDEINKEWTVTTVDGSIYKAQFLVNSMGFLHKPNIPKFKNMDKFKGRMFHSAQWQHNFDYSGKKCAVIGSGCSGIQIVPELAKSASEVNMFQRSPSLILEKQGDGKNTVLMNTLHYMFPWMQWANRVLMTGLSELFYYAWQPESGVGKSIREKAWKDAREQIKDPEFAKKILFDENSISGCKRPAVYTQFYRKFEESHVCKLHCEGVQELTENGIKKSDGSTLEVDLIVLATGFDMFHYKDVPMHAHGKHFEDFWAKIPYAFNGAMHPNFPNYFMMLGPQAGVIHGAGSVFYSEMQAEFFINCLRRTLETGNKTFVVKESAFNQYIKDYRTQVDTVKSWLLNCRSWYQTEDGTPFNPWVFHSWNLLSRCKWPKYDEWISFGK